MGCRADTLVRPLCYVKTRLVASPLCSRLRASVDTTKAIHSVASFRYDFHLMSPAARKPSSLLDTRVIYCGDNLDQLPKLPANSIDLIYIDPPFNSNRNYEVFWGETKEKRSFDDRHASTQAYIEFMRPRCEQLARVLKATGSFYYHCDWHASHYVKVMLDQLFGERTSSTRSSGSEAPRTATPGKAASISGASTTRFYSSTASVAGYTFKSNQLYVPVLR